MYILKIRVHGGVDRGRSQVGDDRGRSQGVTQSSAKMKAHGKADGGRSQGGGILAKPEGCRATVEPRVCGAKVELMG